MVSMDIIFPLHIIELYRVLKNKLMLALQRLAIAYKSMLIAITNVQLKIKVIILQRAFYFIKSKTNFLLPINLYNNIKQNMLALKILC